MNDLKGMAAAAAALTFMVIWIGFIAGIAVWVTDASTLPGNVFTFALGVVVTFGLLFGLWRIMEAWGDTNI